MIAVSFAMIRMAHCIVISGMTGFTFPGMIVLPCCIAFKCNSPMPPPGPEFIIRKSLAIFMRFTASAFNKPETSTNTSLFCVKSIGYSAAASPSPVSRRNSSMTRKRYLCCALSERPTAVPPRLTCLSLSSTL